MRNQPTLNRRSAIAFGLIFALGACASAPATKDAGAAIVSRGYSVDTMSLSVAEGASVGGLFKQDPGVVNQLVSRVGGELRQKAGNVRGGPKKANVSVSLTRISVASAASRSLIGMDTQLNGDVVVTDAAGNVLARKSNVEFVDKGAKNTSTFNGIPVGALLSTVANAGGASNEQRLERLSTGFTNEVVAWLSR
ncbi:hypothetical protein DDZ14_17120 [Maritimibacter sp. 55A14]|nr:hypothetical protein DDZ14_17120 [Maritimibacter sp. 55A14]